MPSRYRRTRRSGYPFKKRLILSLFATKSVAGILLSANFALASQVTNYAQTTQEFNQDFATTTTLSVTLPVCVDGKQESRACITALINAYAKKYDVNQKLALDIAECESNTRGNIFGDHGKAYGTYQFHKGTFREFSKKMGDDMLDYYNNEDNIKLAMWALANNKEYHWSCYDKVTN